MVAKFTNDDFQAEVIDSEIPVVVDFTATWCAPCQKLAPVVEELAGEFEGKVKIGKLDIDEAGDTASKFGVHSVPTLIFFKGGKEVDRMVGFSSKKKLTSKIEKGLLG